jgi:hypothetical protein
VPNSILAAIKQGDWDYEPPEVNKEMYDATEAMPGTSAKLDILAERVKKGLPLWHPHDRLHYDSAED